MAESLVCAGLRGSVVTTSRGNRSLVVHTLQERGNVWRFESSPGPPLTTASQVITCRTVLDISQGVKVPSIATRNSDDSSEVEIFTFSGVQDCNVLTSCGVVHVRDYKAAIEAGLYLLNGPAVVWGEGEAACVSLRGVEPSKPHSLTHHQIMLNKFISHPAKCDRVVDKLWCFDCHNDTVMLFIRLIPRRASQHMKEGVDWLCLSLSMSNDGEFIEVFTIPSHCCIPRDYGYIATCITVYCRWCVEREGGVCPSQELLVGTHYRQVVLLRGGIPLHCVTMETIPSDVAVLEIPGNDVMAFAVSTADKGLTTYRVPAEGELEQLGRWGGVDHVLVGDFANLCRDQLLVAFNESLDEISDFLVTDLINVTVGSQDRMVDERSCPKSDSLISAVKALQVRQRVGEAYLMDVERELQQKKELLRESLQLLQSLGGRAGSVNHTPSPTRDQSLVCVLPGKVGSAESSGGVSDSTHNKPVVTECWQRLLNGHWTVGVALKNTSNSVWRRLCLSLVIDDVVLTESGGSCVVWVHSSQDKGEKGSCRQPAAKYLKTERGEKLEEATLGLRKIGLLQRHLVPPGGQACLVTWATLPTTAMSGVVSGGLMFSWREREGGVESVRMMEVRRVELSGRYLTDPSLRCEWHCLQHWNGEGDMYGQWRDFKRKENRDLACLLASHHITHLTVSSHYTDLSSLASLMTHRLPLPSQCIHTATSPHVIPPGTGISGVLPGTETGEHPELKGVHLYVSGRNKSATISVLHRKSASLSILISALCGCLPDDVTLSTPHSSHTHSHTSPTHHHPSHITGQQTQVMQSCVMALRKEIEMRMRTEEGGREGEEAGTEARMDSELLDAVEETDHAMFRAMLSLERGTSTQ